MLISEIIRKKRDGETLMPDEIGAMVTAISDGSASDAQVAAFGMAVFFQGMTPEEAAVLTLSMRDSGDVFHWDLPGPVVDKHSTGGVGDNVSLMLAPIVAACGGYVPMISGRGLGHTGGTLDKMDSIPGYTSVPDNDTFRKVVAEVGCAIIGQTTKLAPADGRFYGIRDVTATVAHALTPGPCAVYEVEAAHVIVLAYARLALPLPPPGTISFHATMRVIRRISSTGRK